MIAIKSFNRINSTSVRIEALRALQDIFKQQGLDVTIKSDNFSDEEFTVQLSFRLDSAAPHIHKDV